MTNQDKQRNARLLSEVIERTAQSLAKMASGKELNNIDLMHIRGASEQISFVVESFNLSAGRNI